MSKRYRIEVYDLAGILIEKHFTDNPCGYHSVVDRIAKKLGVIDWELSPYMLFVINQKKNSISYKL